MSSAATPLDREEYVEQAHLFRTLRERMQQNMAVQELLLSIKEEVLATTRLPMAMDYLAAELKLHGIMASAMARLGHYFTAFQTFVVAEAENERGKFDLAVALKILEREANFRATGATPQGVFVFQFECLCRNRLGYDRGLDAVAADPIFDAAWKDWIPTVRRQVGIVDFADLIYVRSERYLLDRTRQGLPLENEGKPALFGEREGRIAWANRRKDPLLLFAALHRQLGYPAVPRLDPLDKAAEIIPTLLRRMERLEVRMKLLEEEQRGGIDLSKIPGPPRDETEGPQ